MSEAATADLAAAEAEVAHRLGHGDALSAFDCAAAARKRGLESDRLRYLMVRALAASGDSLGAMHLYDQLGLADTGDVARVTLRLPESLKEAVERAAAAEGISVNSWLVRAVAAAATPDNPNPPRAGRAFGRRVTGFAQA